MQTDIVTNSWHWRYSSSDLKSVDLIATLVESICDECALDADRPRLHILMGEIVNNAIDHGLLKLDSAIKNETGGFDLYLAERLLRLERLSVGTVRITVEEVSDELLRIAVQDSGDGFDYKAVARSEVDPTSVHGRGLVIARQLCESMTHIGCGNCVVVDFPVSRNAKTLGTAKGKLHTVK